VLVVDDTTAKRLAVRAMLAPLGLEVVEADSGRAALHAVLHQAFAVILMDVRMPILDGGIAPGRLILLHAMGERLAIDDFGTGHSSLVHLQPLPIDEVKLDRSFAAGVEDEPALNMLVEYGCDSAEGYLFTRPCPVDQLTKWLTESSVGTPAALGRE
jgi:predicted signal transduction protein with EAL and GGDEF domain